MSSSTHMRNHEIRTLVHCTVYKYYLEPSEILSSYAFLSYPPPPKKEVIVRTLESKGQYFFALMSLETRAYVLRLICLTHSTRYFEFHSNVKQRRSITSTSRGYSQRIIGDSIYGVLLYVQCLVFRFRCIVRYMICLDCIFFTYKYIKICITCRET